MKHIVFVISCLFCLNNIYGQELKKHEIGFGLGWVKAFEKDIFNLSPDAKSSPDVGINFYYLYHVQTNFAVGFHFYGSTETTPNYSTSEGTTSFDLTTLHLGIQGRYIFMRGSVEPYVYAALNLASGTAESKKTGSLDYNGASIGGGLGIGKAFTPSVVGSLEVLSAFGSAKWKQRPFINSGGSKYDPSMILVVANIAYRFSSKM